jgi:hypothetical protein
VVSAFGKGERSLDIIEIDGEEFFKVNSHFHTFW